MGTIYVGIDVSKDYFKATVVDEHNKRLSGCRTYGYKLGQMEQFYAAVERIRKEHDTEALFGMESTGIYHQSLLQYLVGKNASVKVFNGLEVRGIKNRVRRLKTDRLDSEVIAEALILSQDGRLYEPQEPVITELQGLNRARSRLMDKLTECKTVAIENLDVLCPGYSGVFSEIFSQSSINVLNRAFRKSRFLKSDIRELEQAMVHMNVEKAHEKALELCDLFKSSVVSPETMRVDLLELRMVLEEYKLLSQQVSRLDARIEKLVSSTGTHLQTIPGIGLMTAGVILGELGNVRRFQTGSQVVAFAGLDPSVSESGRSRKTGHISKRGSRYLRSALYRAAVSAIRVNPVCKALYDRLKNRGKPSRLCLTAVARKLLLIAYSVEKNNRDFYVPDYIQKEEIPE